MPLLPSSRRQVLLEAGRSDVTPFISAAVKIVPAGIVMNGSSQFEVEIESAERTAAPRAAKPEPHVAPKPEVPAAPKGD